MQLDLTLMFAVDNNTFEITIWTKYGRKYTPIDIWPNASLLYQCKITQKSQCILNVLSQQQPCQLHQGHSLHKNIGIALFKYSLKTLKRCSFAKSDDMQKIGKPQPTTFNQYVLMKLQFFNSKSASFKPMNRNRNLSLYLCIAHSFLAALFSRRLRVGYVVTDR